MSFNKFSINDTGEQLHVAILGAGPAGLAACYSLINKGYKVTCIEGGSEVGGLCRTIDILGHSVDIGPHRFLTNIELVNDFWFSIVGDDYNKLDRKTRICYQGKFFEYPINILECLTKFSFLFKLNILISYLYSVFFYWPTKKNMETWLIKRFGKNLYHIFFKAYSEKLWGCKCSNLSEDFAKQRIKSFSLIKTLLNIKTNDDGLYNSFNYPKNGTGHFYSRLYEILIEKGVVFYLNEKITSVKKYENDWKVNELSESFDLIISSISLNDLCTSLSYRPCFDLNKLKYRSTILVYIVFEIDCSSYKNKIRDNWLYVNDPDVIFGRMTNYSNWNLNKNREFEECVSFEIWCDENDSVWDKSDDEIINIVRIDNDKINILKGYKFKNAKVVRVSKTYPIYYEGYDTDIKAITSDLKTHGIILIGRNGRYRYNNQDLSLFDGLSIVNVIRNNNDEVSGYKVY